tara:strand:- start:190 stop:816 length:627 start_codon:yes stop_codon:yes gene_type:complete
MWALIPINDFSGSLSRLSEHLDRDQRKEMTQILATQVIEALYSVQSIEKIVVLSNERQWLKSFDNQKIIILKDPEIKKLKAKITHAANWIQSQGADQMLYLSVDLPFVQEKDITKFITEHQGGLSIVKAHKENGTNALILDFPAILEFQFGVNSFDKHLATAKAQKINTKIVEIKNLSLDIDTWDDLQEFKNNSMNTQFSNFINRHSL